MAKFSDLNEDTIVAVLLNCDILTVLRVEQTCKQLRKLSFSRHLWLSLIKELDHDHTPVFFPHESLQSLHTERLRDIAVRSTKGYLNWTSSKGPEVTRTSVVDLLEVKDHGVILGMLVPGGKYFVFQAVDGRFHCYDTDEQSSICYYQGAPFNIEEMQYMDCFLDNDETSLILAYVAFKELGEQQNITVALLNLQTGTSTVARTFLCSLTESDDDGLGYYSPVYDKARKIKVNNDVVAAAIYNHIFVAEWRTGKGIITEELGNISGLNVSMEHVLCAIRDNSGRVSLAAAPLSLIFATEGFSGTRHDGNSTLPVPIRSENVFIYISPLSFPEVIKGNVVHPDIGPIAFSTNSWRFSSSRESNALAASTQILVFLCLPTEERVYYMLFRVEFSPSMTNSTSHISQSTNKGPDILRVYTFTLQHQSPLYSYDDDVDTIYLSNTTQTGRCVGSFEKYGSPIASCAIDMHSLAKGTAQKPRQDDTQASSESGFDATYNLVPRYQEICGDYHFAKCDDATRRVLNVEEYSGAVWYIRDSSLVIHYFD